MSILGIVESLQDCRNNKTGTVSGIIVFIIPVFIYSFIYLFIHLFIFLTLMYCYLWLKGCYCVWENVHNLLIFVNLQVLQESVYRYTQLEKKETFPSYIKLYGANVCLSSF